MNEKRDTRDILFMFETVPTNLWIGLLISFITFILILRTGNRLLRDRDQNLKSNPIWTTTSAFLSQNDFPISHHHVNLLSFIMSIGVFFAVAYLTNSVSTDLVVLEDPVTIETYDDILDRGISILVPKVHFESTFFKNARQGTTMHSLARNVIYSDVTRERLLEKYNVGTSQNNVIIMRKSTCNELGLAALGMIGKEYPRARGLLRQDEETIRTMEVLIFRKGLPKFISMIYEQM